MNMGFPDVCLTPSVPAPIPIPYPNMGMHAMAVPFCPTILNMMMPALNMGSIIPMTLGDQPGVANPLFMQLGMFTMGSPKVILQGMPAVTLASMTAGNAMNNPVGGVTLPGAPTILYGYSGPVAGAGLVVSSGRAVSSTWLPSGVGRLAIRVFTPGVAAEFHSALRELDRLGLSKLQVDLSDNPGGDVLAAIEILRDLLPEGAVVAVLTDRDGDEITYLARGDAYPWPLEVRVNAGTASAAELFAGCLQAHGRARIVGETTYGKSAVRVMGAEGWIDVASVRLPGGAEIERLGRPVRPGNAGPKGVSSR
jgi:carboxyl-terminal processing protease